MYGSFSAHPPNGHVAPAAARRWPSQFVPRKSLACAASAPMYACLMMTAAFDLDGPSIEIAICAGVCLDD
jgi:hypothetical protein